jgi:two-component system response regulator GlrR
LALSLLFYENRMSTDDGHAEDEASAGRETDKLGRPDQAEVALVPRLRLVVTDGADRGAVFTPAGPRASVGSHPSNDVVLADRSVSRFHCEIVLDAGRARVRDLGSSNGTFVDGVSALEAWLGDGLTLTLGETRLRFAVAPEKAELRLSERHQFGPLVGHSTAMRATFALLEAAARTDATVLLQGETGTGKGAAAEGLHLESGRSARPFVVVDCASIPGELLESELFGHLRGAFTGAVGARTGAFEAAAGGTIFLDEIGELPPELQPKLLRALENREIKRIGETKYRSIDVRVVAATNRDLRAEVNAGRFRSDLYFRLAVLEVRLPPLRELRDELPGLVEQLLKRLDAAERPEAAYLRTPQFHAQLARHPWPGNVRELRNHVERALTLQGQARLEAHGSAGEPIAAAPSTLLPLRAAKEAFERSYAVALLAEHGDNVSAAARAAGIDRIAFYRLLWRHGLR